MDFYILAHGQVHWRERTSLEGGSSDGRGSKRLGSNASSTAHWCVLKNKDGQHWMHLSGLVSDELVQVFVTASDHQ